MIKSFLKISILIIILVTVGFLFYHYNLYIHLTDREKGIQFIKSFHPYDAIVFISLQILQVLIAPFPGEATGFIGGYIYGAVPGTIYSTIGLSIGSWLAFILSKTFGMPFVEKIIKAETIKKYDHFIENQGTYISLVLFLIPGFPKDTLCYILGLSHMKAGIFMVISTLGRLLGTIFLSVGGASLYNDQRVLFIILLIIGGLVFLWGVIHSKIIMNRYKNKKKS